MVLDVLTPWQWASLGALTIAGVASVALVSSWVALAARPRWFWRVAALLALLYPVIRTPALSLWIALVIQAGTIIVGLSAFRVAQQVRLTRLTWFRARKPNDGSTYAPLERPGAPRWQFAIADLVAITCVIAILTAGLARQFDRPFPRWDQPVRFGLTFGTLSLVGLWIGSGAKRWYGWVARVVVVLCLPRFAATWIQFESGSMRQPMAEPLTEQQFLLAMALLITVASWAALVRRCSSAWQSRSLFDRFWRAGALATSLVIVTFVLVGCAALNNDPGMPQAPIPRPNGYDEFTEATRSFWAQVYLFNDDAWQKTDAQLATLVADPLKARAKAKSAVRLPSSVPLRNSYENQFSWLTFNSGQNTSGLLAAWQAETIVAARRGDRAAAVEAVWDILEVSRVQRQGGMLAHHFHALQTERLAMDTLRDLPGWPRDAAYHALIPRLAEWETRIEPFTAAEVREGLWLRHIDWTCRIEHLLNSATLTLDTRQIVPPPKHWTARRRLVTTELALSKYQAEHGEYPERLEQLVPEILPAVPEDAFGEGPLKYRRAGYGYVLYSVGIDGRDNRGLASPAMPLSDDYDIVLPQPRHPRLPPTPQ